MTSRPAIVLLEVMIALAILAVAGLSLLTLAGESAVAIQRAARADRANQSASDFLATVSLWSATDLDRRLGARRQGPWLLEIHREEPGLYTAALLDTLSRRPLLVTALFRQDATP